MPEEPDRAIAALPQAYSGNLETKSRTRTRGTTRNSLCNWAWDVDIGSALSATCQKRGASRRLEPKPPVWVCLARSELTPRYDILL